MYNIYYLYKLIFIDEIDKIMTYKDFQHEIAIKLLKNPKVFDRKRPLTIFISTTNKRFILPQEHRLIRISRKEYYKIYKINKEKPAKR